MDLDRKKKVLFADNHSIFEYEDILDILNKGYISKNHIKILVFFMMKRLLILKASN